MFLKNKNIIFKIKRSKVTDYAALKRTIQLVMLFLPLLLFYMILYKRLNIRSFRYIFPILAVSLGLCFSKYDLL